MGSVPGVNPFSVCLYLLDLLPERKIIIIIAVL